MTKFCVLIICAFVYLMSATVVVVLFDMGTDPAIMDKHPATAVFWFGVIFPFAIAWTLAALWVTIKALDAWTNSVMQYFLNRDKS